MLMHNYALARCASADNIPQLFMTMGAMGGHMGKSGHACGGAYKTYAGAGGPALVKFGETACRPRRTRWRTPCPSRSCGSASGRGATTPPVPPTA